jgi:hypothetical protein
MNLMAEIFTVLLRIVCYGYVENTQRLTELLPFENCMLWVCRKYTKTDRVIALWELYVMGM